MYALDSDLTSWTSASATTDGAWYDITYGDGYFVAIAETGTARVMYSSDGINWSAAAAASQKEWNDIAYGDGYFVATNRNDDDNTTTSNCVMWAKSSNISTWTMTDVAVARQYNGVALSLIHI